LNEIKNYGVEDPPAINTEIQLESGDKGLFLGIYYRTVYTVLYNDGTTDFIHPEDIYSEDEQGMGRLNLQGKRGLKKYLKEKKLTWLQK
ncbi:hypothetical protein INO76_15495, partial [Staphylococcus aureus]|nr:hypothetical protein [Staphylococcus aureus]